MQLHLPTLLLANLSVVTLCGLLMLFSWWRGRAERTLLWLALMMLSGALGLAFNSIQGPGIDWLSEVLGNVILLLSIGMSWTALRVFCGRQPVWSLMLLGALVWLLLCLWPPFRSHIGWLVLAFTLLLVLYQLAAVGELWLSRQQLQVSIVPAMVLMLLHGLFYILRSLLMDYSSPDMVRGSPLFAWVLLETMLYAVGMAFVGLSMVKERAEAGSRCAALIDPLTGIGNRRAFISGAEELLQRCASMQQPVALLLCDLDEFKAINDLHGHPEGDRVLCEFACSLRTHLDRSAVCGRIGGEEFAALLAGTLEQAVEQAERIRRDFASRASPACMHSVSIGVVGSDSAGHDLKQLLIAGDRALYQAKALGRNRVFSCHYAGSTASR
jgi:diguanylate cyclase (GGDEF)-like protein